MGLGGLGLGAALAQDGPLRRYKPVIVGIDDKGADDAELVALIDNLKQAVRKRDVAAIRNAAAPTLAIVTPPVGFPPANAPKPLKLDGEPSGPQRLDKAIALLAGEGEPDRKRLDALILATVAEALSSGTIGRSALVRGALCAPAEPKFNRGQVLAIAEAAGEVPDNLVILIEETVFLEKPDTAAAAIATLKPGSVVPFVEGAVEGADGKRDWYAIGLPTGRRGYAKGDRSTSFEATRLCFTKEGPKDSAAWAISTVIVPNN